MENDATGRAERLAFKESTDLLTASGATLADVARAFDVSLNTVHRWRREDDRLRPRDGWRAVVREMAAGWAEENRRRTAALSALARKLK